MLLFLFTVLWASELRAQSDTPEDSLVAVSADIVEITGSLSRNTGFAWPGLNGGIAGVNGPYGGGILFLEKTIPGLYTIGDFARQTQLATTLRLLESEGKAQVLSNPKVIIVAGSGQATFNIGTKVPIPVVSAQGAVGSDMQQAFTTLQVAPIINPNKKDTIRAEVALEVANFDFGNTVQIGSSNVPSINSRQLQTTVEVKSGETLVMGGFKFSQKTLTVTRVPFIGRVPLIGLLFTTKTIEEDQRTLFLFITMEIIK
jgi:type II secretory pathway component GspD/PulD (secretin)